MNQNTLSMNKKVFQRTLIIILPLLFGTLNAFPAMVEIALLIAWLFIVGMCLNSLALFTLIKARDEELHDVYKEILNKRRTLMGPTLHVNCFCMLLVVATLLYSQSWNTAVFYATVTFILIFVRILFITRLDIYEDKHLQKN